MKIDLHCHTVLSDGSLETEEAILLAACKGVDVLALTDHDTISGDLKAQEYGRKNNVKIISGVEISAIDKKRNRKVHILCYNPNVNVVEPIIAQTRKKRSDAMLNVIPSILKKFPMPEEMIWKHKKKSTSIYKQHVMHALMNAGYADAIFGDVFSGIFGRGGFAEIKVDYPDVHELLAGIKSAGGTYVMAHPSEYKSLELLEELFKANLLDGAEVYHPKNTEEDKTEILSLCKKYNKIKTGGTDFHGFYAGKRPVIGTFLTPQEEYAKIILNGEI